MYVYVASPLREQAAVPPSRCRHGIALQQQHSKAQPAGCCFSLSPLAQPKPTPVASQPLTCAPVHSVPIARPPIGSFTQPPAHPLPHPTARPSTHPPNCQPIRSRTRPGTCTHPTHPTQPTHLPNSLPPPPHTHTSFSSEASLPTARSRASRAASMSPGPTMDAREMHSASSVCREGGWVGGPGVGMLIVLGALRPTALQVARGTAPLRPRIPSREAWASGSPWLTDHVLLDECMAK